MKIKLNIARPGEKRETTTRKSGGDRVQRSVAGGARDEPLRSSDFRGGSSSSRGSSKYDYDQPSDDDKYGSSRRRNERCVGCPSLHGDDL